tara:strand:- start:4169 stop:4294 length:126 start_codon:yes stop_codon:yes gene_type:complete
MLNEIILGLVDDIIMHYGLHEKETEAEFFEYAFDFIREVQE